MAVFEQSNQPDALADAQPPKDFSHFFSRVTLARKESKIKSFYKYFMIPGIGNLAGGLPNASLFPFDTLEAQIARPDRFKPTPNDPNDPNKDLTAKLAATALNNTRDTSAASHITVPHASAIPNPMQKIDLTTALQYGQALGYPPLHSFLRQFTRENLHPNIPYLKGAEIILTCGSTDGFAKTLELLTNVWSEEKDWIGERPGLLCEEFAYMNAIQAARPRGIQVATVKIDLEGMIPDGPGGLEDVLANWDDRKGRRPHMLYTVTIGQNPTSGTLSIQRRKDLYAICSKYDVIIIEDDPYWYLQFPSASLLESQSRNLPTPPPAPIHKFAKSSGYPFLNSLVPSYLSVDTEGRVIRLDTFSKTVAPGCRLGWITAQPAIIERLLRITESSTQQPSGFVQSTISELIMGPQPTTSITSFKSKKTPTEISEFSGWQTEGWVRWLEGLRGSYERRMNTMCTHLESSRHLLKQKTPIIKSPHEDEDWQLISKTTLYTFSWPRGGMFIWIKVNFSSHPLSSKFSGARLSHLLWIYLTMSPYLVLVAPGAIFSPTERILEEEGWKYFRLCFAAVEEEEVERSAKGFGEGVKAFWRIKRVEDMKDIEDGEGVMGMEGVVDLGRFAGAC